MTKRELIVEELKAIELSMENVIKMLDEEEADHAAWLTEMGELRKKTNNMMKLNSDRLGKLND